MSQSTSMKPFKSLSRSVVGDPESCNVEYILQLLVIPFFKLSLQGTVAKDAQVIPISAQLKYNIDVVCEYIQQKIPIPKRNFTAPPNMIVIRSFDVNKPGSEVDEIKGGVAGGSILEVLIIYMKLLHLYIMYRVVSCLI